MRPSVPTYIITGASKGIGRDTVRQLAKSQRYIRVLAIARDAALLKELKKELSALHQLELHTLALDLTSADQSVLLDWLAEHGPVDGLINNAGLLINRPFGQLEDEDWQSLLAINLLAPARLIRLLLPHLRSPGAHLVNVSSMGGYQGSAKFPGLSAYSASKGALAILTECLAEEFKEQGISVNCLALGAVQTEMLATAFPGYAAPLKSVEMAEYFAWFLEKGQQFFNGKVLPVSVSTP
ncbi:MAG: SDR family oxidoreductase [Bacteroidota bacterium]